MYLLGTPGEIIGDLRTNKGWTKLKLSQMTGIPQSQLSRIESGKITHISSDILFLPAQAVGRAVIFIDISAAQIIVGLRPAKSTFLPGTQFYAFFRIAEILQD